MISDPVVRPKIVKAAGSSITAARRMHVRSAGSRIRQAAAAFSNTLRSLRVVG
jgi:hypothetical protein